MGVSTEVNYAKVVVNGKNVTVPTNPISIADIDMGVFFNYVNGSESKVYLKLNEDYCMDMESRRMYQCRSMSDIRVYTDVNIAVTGLVSARDKVPTSLAARNRSANNIHI